MKIMTLKEFLESLQEYSKNFNEDQMRFYSTALMVAEQRKLTDKGILILRFMQGNMENYSNLFKAQDIGCFINLAPRSVSGAMKKLITDGYISKQGQNPIYYQLTDLGKTVKLD